MKAPSSLISIVFVHDDSIVFVHDDSIVFVHDDSIALAAEAFFTIG